MIMMALNQFYSIQTLNILKLRITMKKLNKKNEFIVFKTFKMYSFDTFVSLVALSENCKTEDLDIFFI